MRDPARQAGTENLYANVLPLKDAREKVESILDAIDPATKSSGRARTIRDHYCVGRDKVVKSGYPDEGVQSYVFNLGHDEGYAIVAADSRVDQPVMIITDRGYLDPEQEIDNPVLIDMLMLADNYCRGQVELAETEGIPDTKTESYSPWSVSTSGRRTFLNWGQYEPFNNNLPMIGGDRVLLGCTATATMLLMAWHRHPEVYAGHEYDWDEMLLHRNTATNADNTNKNAYGDIARLSEIITRPENLDTDFGVEASSAYAYNIPRTLRRLGYSNGGTYATWDKDIVMNELRYNGYPVVVSAYSFREIRTYWEFEWVFLGFRIVKKSYYYHSGGHAFLLENTMCRMRRQLGCNPGDLVLEAQILVYANFGWDGDSNGYYYAGMFDTPKGPVTRVEGEKYNYQFNIEMLYGIRE